MDFNRIPRWVLVWGFMGFTAIGGMAFNGAYADLSETKLMAQRHDLLIPQLVDDIKEIKVGNESFRKEYREDQKDLDKKLTLILNKA